MLPDDVIDLDKNVVNAGDPDLGYFPNQRGRMTLLAQGGTVLAQYDFAAPSLADCQAASLGEGQIALRNLPLGLYVCYRTGQGNYGWLRVINWTETEAPVEIEILTWYTPST